MALSNLAYSSMVRRARPMICTFAACASAPMANISLLPVTNRSEYVCVECFDLWLTNLLQIWDIQKKHIHTIFEGHQKEIYSLDFSRDGRLIVSGSGDGTVRIWDMNDTASGQPFKVCECWLPSGCVIDLGTSLIGAFPRARR